VDGQPITKHVDRPLSANESRSPGCKRASRIRTVKEQRAYTSPTPRLGYAAHAAKPLRATPFAA
jgi:hypothetical protein